MNFATEKDLILVQSNKANFPYDSKNSEDSSTSDHEFINNLGNKISESSEKKLSLSLLGNNLDKFVIKNEEHTCLIKGRWNKKEQINFLKAMHKYGRDWEKIKEEINTRSELQIRSHFQKLEDKIRNKFSVIDTVKYIQSESLENLSDLFSNSRTIIIRNNKRIRDSGFKKEHNKGYYEIFLNEKKNHFHNSIFDEKNYMNYLLSKFWNIVEIPKKQGFNYVKYLKALIKMKICCIKETLNPQLSKRLRIFYTRLIRVIRNNIRKSELCVQKLSTDDSSDHINQINNHLERKSSFKINNMIKSLNLKQYFYV